MWTETRMLWEWTSWFPQISWDYWKSDLSDGVHSAWYILGCYQTISVLVKTFQCHWIALLHVLRYMRGTAAYELCYRQCEKDLRLTGYSDSDWASSAEDRRSTSGYCFSLTEEGPLISWRSRKQPAVALSTCEAEYIALAAAVALALVIMIKIICLWSLRIIREQLL